MAQQWITDAAREAFRERDDAADQAAEAATIRAWLATLPLEARLIATLDEPIAALEDGIRRAARGGVGVRPSSERRGDSRDRT